MRAAGCVFAEDEAALLIAAATTPAQLDVLLARREAGEPLEHVVGWAELAGRRYAVEPGVFVPRRRSDLLVSAAVARGGPRSVVLDLCCGSGALGAAVAAVLGPSVELHATDVEPAAVRCARRNVPGTVYEGDLFAPLPDRLRHNVDLLVANVPYVPSDEIALMPAEARDHEPRVALDGGTDGLDVLRRVAAEAPVWLAPGGHLLTETSARQAPSAVAVLTRAGLTAGVVHDDDLEATVVIGLLSDQHDRDPTCRSNRVGFDG